ncbi:hypothetical protein [Roseobacter sp.]|uniref:hypothetical protein n=1 Tax=Roseobacter sp. TaxID=1907202 RepID=UPI0038598A76
MRLIFISGVAGLLCACATVTSQSAGTITVDGKTYQTITREFQAGKGAVARSYATTTVAVGAQRINCVPDAPENCEKTIRRTELGDGRPSVDGPVNANIFNLPFGL